MMSAAKHQTTNRTRNWPTVRNGCRRTNLAALILLTWPTGRPASQQPPSPPASPVTVPTVILAPGACGRWAPSRGPCHHFRLSGDRVDEFPKRPSCCYTRHFRAREVRGPFRAMRRLRSWSGSPRSRARESIAKSTFIRKTHMIWKTFFHVFAERSPTPYFYNELSPSR